MTISYHWRKRPLKTGNVFWCGLHTGGCLITKKETLKEKESEGEERRIYDWRF